MGKRTARTAIMGALLPLLGTDFDMAQQGACEDILYDRL